MKRRRFWAAAVTALVAMLLGIFLDLPGARALVLPDTLTDQEFWQLSSEASEPGGYFRNSDVTNLTSNELLYQRVLTDLVRRTKPGGVYLGVGPEQNYTYIAALKPRLAIIFDIRRGNLDLQLMYKAVFEMSKDRADFISLLFSRQRPAGVTSSSSVGQLFASFAVAPVMTEGAFEKNLAAIKDRLTKIHRFPLLQRDIEAIGDIYRTFYESGYDIRPSPTYAELMTATDEHGIARSYLATEDYYLLLKDLESRNLVVPVVGDFGGPKAIRAIARYLKSNGATVTAFYLSNVEQYLFQDGKWDTFCRSVAALPLDTSSTFIRSESGGGGFRFGPGFISMLGQITTDIQPCTRN